MTLGVKTRHPVPKIFNSSELLQIPIFPFFVFYIMFKLFFSLPFNINTQKRKERREMKEEILY